MDLEKYKQVISDAVQNEIEAKEFYDKIARQIKDDYLKELFEGFSKEEAKHEQILKGILRHERDSPKDVSVGQLKPVRGFVGHSLKNLIHKNHDREFFNH